MRPQPTPEQLEDLCRIARSAGAPRPPSPPVAGECCGRSCEPCVWDYYDRAIDRWAEKHALSAVSRARR